MSAVIIDTAPIRNMCLAVLDTGCHLLLEGIDNEPFKIGDRVDAVAFTANGPITVRHNGKICRLYVLNNCGGTDMLKPYK